MKHTNLKEKLDNVKQDFDKEALWHSINNRPQKRRSFLWIVGFFMCSLLVVTFVISKIYFSQDNSYVDSKSAANDNLLSIENLKLEAGIKSKHLASREEYQARTILNKPNEVLPSDHNVRKHDAAQLPKAIDRPYITTSAKSITNSSITILPSWDNGLLTSVTIDENPKHNNPEIQLVGNQSHLQDTISQYIAFDENTDDTLSFLLPIHPYLTSKWQDSISLAYVKNQESDKQNIANNYNMIGLSVGVGVDNHRFSEFRKQFEKSLENQSLSFVYNRKIMHHFIVETKLSYSLSQTHVTFTSIDTTWRMNAQNKAVKSWTGNKYDLYNQYQRLDAVVSIGYVIEIGKAWQLRPSLGLGINILHKENGDTWDREYSRQAIQLLAEYDHPTKSFVLYQLQLSKSLANHFNFGFGLSMQSIRTLASDDLYHHQIRPMAIEIIVGRYF